nr:unnamed protein product [Naegleria fowleri]
MSDEGQTTTHSNIQVVCRFRPMNALEKQIDAREVVEINHDTCKLVNKLGKHEFTFDHIFNSSSKQIDIFNVVGRPIVEDIFKGYNGTIFVYGQTGSGKSYTMMGPNEELKGYCTDTNLKGLIPRIVENIFEKVENSDPDIEFTIQVSYIEIYLEKIRDLLDPTQQNLKIKEDKESGRGVYIKGATEEYVTSIEEVFSLLKLGAGNRVVSSTRQKHLVNLDSKSGKLFLVDLAGSEKVKKTGASGQTLEEAKNINKSLSTLGMVINALTDGVSKYVPYRDSKLTRLLQDSLGGNSRTTLIINCSLSAYNEDETLSTLRFGFRAKNIKNKPKVNRELSAKELQKLLDKAKEEIKDLKNYITGLEEELKIYKKGGIKSTTPIPMVDTESNSSTTSDSEMKRQELEAKLNEILPTISRYREKCLILERELAEEKNERNKLVDENSQLKDEINQGKEENNALEESLTSMKQQLKQKAEYMVELESAKNDLQKLIQLKTNECQELQNVIKEERNNKEYQLKEMESDLNSTKQQRENYMKQLNETKIQLLTLQAKQEDPSLEHVMQFLEKKYKRVRKQAKKASSTSQDISMKKSNSANILKKVQKDLKSIKNDLEDASESDEEVEEDDEESEQEIEETEAQNKIGETVDENSSPTPQLVTIETQTEQNSPEEEYFEFPTNINAIPNDMIIDNSADQKQLLEALEKIRLLEAEVKKISNERDALLGDLSNRVQKVIELEMLLDDVSDKYNTLSSHNIIRKYTKKIEFLESNVASITASFQELYSENEELKHHINLSEKKIKMKDERINELTNQLLEQSQRSKKDADAFVEERSKLNDIITTLRYENEVLKNAQVGATALSSFTLSSENEATTSSSSSKVRRPLRGGGSLIKKKTDEDEYFSSPGSTHELDIELESQSLKYATVRGTKNAPQHHVASNHKKAGFSLRDLFFGAKSKSETSNMEQSLNNTLDDTND